MRRSSFAWRELKLEEAGTWPLLPKLFLYLLALAAGIVLVYWLLIKPDLAFIQSTNGQANAVRQQVEGWQPEIEQLDAQQQRVDELKLKLQRASQVLPEQQEQPQLIDDVAKHALESNLNLTDFRPGDEIASGQFYELPINIAFEGDYHAFGRFIAKVSSMERLVIPTQLQLDTSNPALAPGVLSGELVLKTFRFKELSETTSVTTAQ